MTDLNTLHASLAILGVLALVISHCAERYQRNRADNLEIRVTDLEYALDDAERDRDRWRDLHSGLVRENSTLCVDLLHTERRNVQLQRQILAHSLTMTEPSHYQANNLPRWN